jgi:hypothetical protein
VCVQPMLTSWARRSEDLTFDKTDEKDAVLIARLTAQLRCYVPEPVDETWGRLRHLGTRREQLITANVSQIQQIRALLECVWPASLDAANYPFRSKTWAAAMSVVCDRDGGDLDRTRRLGLARFEQAVRREINRRGNCKRVSLRIVRKLFAALTSGAGVFEHRLGALERVQLLLTDWVEDQYRLVDTEARMVAVLDELQLTDLVTSIVGISPGRCRGDPCRVRRPAPVHHRPRVGETRRSRSTGEALGHVHRPHQTHRPRPARTAPGRVACGLGRATRQSRIRRPLSAFDQQRQEQTHRHPSAGLHRRGDPAATARRHRHRTDMGPRHRRRRSAHHRTHPRRCLTNGGTSSGLVGASPTRH